MKQYIQPFIHYLVEEKGVSAATREAYQHDVESFLSYIDEQGIEEPDDVRRLHLAAYLNGLKKDKASATVARSLIAIRALFHFLIREGVTLQDPTVLLEAPKKEKKVPVVLTTEDMEKLLETPDISSAQGLRDRAMLELLYATGMRVSELVGLNVNDVHVELRYVHCTDSKGNERIIPISREACLWLERYLDKHNLGTELDTSGRDTHRPLFINAAGGRLSRQGLWKILKKHAALLGMEDKLTPHTLRHSFAMHLVHNGADLRAVQDLLGHADVSTTRMYAHTSKGNMKDIYEKFHPRASKSSTALPDSAHVGDFKT
ncbi:site-specific tyrosine recombinase XerD [Paenibacillus sp. FSL K6-1230]|uniref:site-specific tyrosine recombinase XerD n=1 Tax=Paenibacillus sp. FSL K6-1230 TaxID=2921603 RepID=UPI0003A2BFAE